MRTMTVKVVPIPGAIARVVKEGLFGRYHTEADGVFEVPENGYYMRRIAHGELVRAEVDKKPAPKKDDDK